MKITLVFVTSVDGRVTRWGDPDVAAWTSAQDQEHFHAIWKKARLIVLGSRTFLAEQIKPPGNSLLVVMTHDPGQFRSRVVPGRLEFTNASPAELLSRFTEEGYDEMLVAGGPHVAASFLGGGLVDELWLTIEPKIFGSGDSLFGEGPLDITLRLLSSRQVNPQGTLINRYQVLKP
jgi:dihydrofolate reductase